MHFLGRTEMVLEYDIQRKTQLHVYKDKYEVLPSFLNMIPFRVFNTTTYKCI